MRSSRFALGLPLVVPMALATGGCPDRTIAAINPQQQGAVTKAIPVSADIDILFVIDNSASTADKQAVFLANMGSGFVTALDSFPCSGGGSGLCRPNLHIAVVNSTTDIGNPVFNNEGCPSPDPMDNGLMRNTITANSGAPAGCMPQTGQFISDISDGSGGRITNYPSSEQLAEVLQCIGAVGTSGCGFETQLEAMKRALDGTNPQNAGFLRDGAYLAVIFLTDEDDASTKDPSVFSLPAGQVGGVNDFRVQPMFAYNCDETIQANSGSNYTNCKPRTDSYLQDPAFYSQFLASVKNPDQTVVAVVAGPPPGLQTNDNPSQTANTGPTGSGSIATGSLQIVGSPAPQTMALEPSATCTVNGQAGTVARPAIRLASFLTAYGTNGRFYNVCQSDYTAALTDIGNTLFNAISPCLEGDINTTDADPNNPGVQLQCTVTDTQQVGSGASCPDGSTPNNGECQEQIPICKMTNPTTPASGQGTCAWFPQNTTSCPAPNSGYELTVIRSGAAPTGTVTDVECAVNTTNGSSS